MEWKLDAFASVSTYDSFSLSLANFGEADAIYLKTLGDVSSVPRGLDTLLEFT